MHLWTIALLAIVVMHDAASGPGGPAGPRGVAAWAAVLAPYAAIAVLTQLVCWAAGRDVDRRGDARSVRAADRMLASSRAMAVALHAIAVWGLGWVETVRRAVGDLVLVDELIAVLPPLVTMAAAWWSYWPIDRRLREAALLRVLEEGHPPYPPLSRGGYVLMQVRHQMLLTLVPVLMLGAWSETVEMALGRLRDAGGTVGGWLGGTGDPRAATPAEWVRLAAQLAGAAVVFACAPAVLKALWDTVPLTGPLHDRLLRLCERARVRVRAVLVWRTYGTMINGAAVGVVPRLRYILLTDSLLDLLPERQVEAVMSHEVGHVRHRHIPWMVGAVVACVGLGTTLVWLAAVGLVTLLGVAAGGGGELGVHAPGAGPHALGWVELAASGGVTLGGLVLGLVGFGAVSRRFEWQADAFAVRQLSEVQAGPDAAPEGAGVATEEAARAMCGALESVAVLNHIPRDRWSFRHGSIRTRQRKIMSLVGRPLDRLGADVVARRVKTMIVVGAAAAIGASVALESFDPGPPAAPGDAAGRGPGDHLGGRP